MTGVEERVLLDFSNRPSEGGGTVLHGEANAQPVCNLVKEGGLEAIDVAYRGIKDHLEKGLFLLAEDEETKCAICREHVDHNTGMIVVCPVQDCRAASHIACLSSRFLTSSASAGAVIPTKGTCPNCQTTIRWVDLVKELTLRIRGEKEIEKLMRKPRSRKGKATSRDENASVAEVNSRSDTDGEGEVEASQEDAAPVWSASDVANIPPFDDGWQYRVDEDDDAMSMTSARSDISRAFIAGSPLPKTRTEPEIVIEESDWDYAEVLS